MEEFCGCHGRFLSLQFFLCVAFATAVTFDKTVGVQQRATDPLKLHLANYFAELGSTVYIANPLTPSSSPPPPPPPQLQRSVRWGDYLVDRWLDRNRRKQFRSTAQYSFAFVEKCSRAFRRRCSEVFSVPDEDQSALVLHSVHRADIIRVFQGQVGPSFGGIPEQLLRQQRTRRPRMKSGGGGRKPSSSDADHQGPRIDGIDEELEMQNSSGLNLLIYISVYANHVCSYALRPSVVDWGDVLRLKCQITVKSFWTPTIYFRNDYEGSEAEGSTVPCGTPLAPNSYCSTVDVRANGAVLEYSCRVRYSAADRFIPTVLPQYSTAVWTTHSHQSPVCHLEKIYINTIPIDVELLCDRMTCDSSVEVGVEILCRSVAHPTPEGHLSVAILRLSQSDAQLFSYDERRQETEATNDDGGYEERRGEKRTGVDDNQWRSEARDDGGAQRQTKEKQRTESIHLTTSTDSLDSPVAQLTFVVLPEHLGKVLEVKCHLSNSLGFGSNALIVEVVDESQRIT